MHTLKTQTMTDGFLVVKDFLKDAALIEIDNVLNKFHSAWLVKNDSIYKSGAINSAYITSGEFLTKEERLILLKFVSSKKVVDEAKKMLGNELHFLNTQIFFDPHNGAQKNYWHRDIQYTGQSESKQRETIEKKEHEVIHLRFALADERGIEFIPKSHFKWDTEEQLDVRLKRNGRTQSDALAYSQAVSLERRDLLIFDANIIHRGLYGGERFAFDVLFCKSLPEILQYRSNETLPTPDELKFLECPEIFN